MLVTWLEKNAAKLLVDREAMEALKERQQDISDANEGMSQVVEHQDESESESESDSDESEEVSTNPSPNPGPISIEKRIKQNPKPVTKTHRNCISGEAGVARRRTTP